MLKRGVSICDHVICIHARSNTSTYELSMHGADNGNPERTQLKEPIVHAADARRGAW